MRMWNVNTDKMCRQHLLGEHLEMHMFVGALAHGQKLSGYINNGMVHLANLYHRHDELVAEMVKRGYKHRSPLLLPKSLGVNIVDYETNNVDILHNEAVLRERCKECKF